MEKLKVSQRLGPSNRMEFRIRGNLNHAAHSTLEEILASSQSGPADLDLDLSGVGELDLRGLTWLLNLESRLRSRGQNLQLIRPGRGVRRVLRLVHPAVREWRNL